MWPFETKIVGQPVNINCGPQSPGFRKHRAETRIENLTGKLGRLYNRPSSKIINQEIANTKVAIRKWQDVLEVAELEIEQLARGD